MRSARLLGWLSAVALAVGLAAAFGYAPREAAQGNVQRIMYVHVPSVLTAYAAFLAVLVGSVGYLRTRDGRWDRLAASAAELGVLFMGITLVSGSIWGKATWGTYWTWDARITTASILFVVYVGYLLLRAAIDDADQRARLAAVVGIFGAANILIVHRSVTWWRSLHQEATILGPGPAPLAFPFKVTLALNVVAFGLLFAYLLILRLRVARLEEGEAGAGAAARADLAPSAGARR
jgi:heme exporter protein C